MVLGIVVVFAGGAIARAQSTWQGGGTDTTWSTSGNWSTPLANGFSAGLVFQGASSLANTNDLTSGTATSITFNAGAGAFTIDGNAIALTGNIANNSSNLQSIANNITLLANSTVTGTNVTLSGALTNSGGNLRLTNGLGTGDLLTLGAINLSEGDTGRTFQLSGTGNTTISGAIADGGSGAASFAVGGSAANAYSGTVTFAGNSTYSGTTTFANNTLAVAIGSDQAFGTSVVNFNNNRIAGGALATTDVTLTNRVNIGTTFTFAGTNSIELAGPTYMMAGTQLGSAISGAGKLLTISGTLFLQDSGTAGRVVTLGPSIVSGPIKDSANGQGSSGLSMTSAGTYALSGSNTYSGGTLFNGNVYYTLDLGNKSALGKETGSLTFAQGNLTIRASADLGGSNAISNAIAMNATTHPLTVGGSNNVAFAGNLTGSGRLTITNTGVTTLSGTNSYAGPTAVNGGTLVFGGTQAKAGGTVTAAAAGSIGLGVGGANSYTSADVAALFGNTLSGFTMNAASGVAVDTTGGNFTISDALASSRAFTKLGPNTLTLSGNNSFGGTFTVSEGAVSVATINNASANGPLGNSAGAVLLGSSGKTGALEYTGTTASSTKPFTAVAGGTAAFSVTNAAAVLTLSGAIDGNGDKSFGGPGSYVIAGSFGGTGTVFKTGAGALTLTQAGHAGGYQIQAGRLNLDAAPAIGNATSLVLGSGIELDNASPDAVTINNNGVAISLGSSLDFIGTKNLNMGGGTVTLGATAAIDVQAGTLTFGGNVVDGGNAYGITKSGAGTLVLSGLTASAFTGNSVVSAGELYLSGTSTLGGTGATTLTVQDGATLRVGPTASKGAVSLVIDGGQVLYESLQDGPVEFAANSVLNSSNAFANGVQTIAAGVVVSSAEDWFGSIPGAATQGRIVMENGAVLRSTNAISINANKGIELAGASATFNAATGSIFINSQVTGTGALVKTGTGGFRILNQSNSYAGGTEIREGTFGIYGDGSLGQAGTRVLIDGAILNSGQGTSGQTVTVSSARSIVLGNGKTSNLDATNGSTLAYAGVITEENAEGAAASLRIGTAGFRLGTVQLGGANTYRGDTILNAGTLKLASGGSFANSPRIVVGDAGSAGAVLDLTEKSSFSIGVSQKLMGGGSVNLGVGTVFTVSGTFSPGNSPGLFTYASGTTLLAGTTLMEIWGTSRATSPSHGDGFYDAVNVTSGGVLDFNNGVLSLSFDSLFSVGDTFQLFQALDTASLAGNFGSVNVTGSYYTDLTWTKSGSLWESTPAVGGESLSFNAATGLLSVAIAVPEPGSLGLAGIGMAFAGWAAARHRRRVRGVARP